MKALACALMLMATPALAHSDGEQEYPAKCCHKMDCAPADRVEVVETQRFVAAGLGFVGSLKLPAQTVITTKHGTVVVPEDFPQEATYDSTDGRTHACIRTVNGKPRLICLFKPSGT